MILVGKDKALLTIGEAELASKHLKPVFDGPIASRVHELFGKMFETQGTYAGGSRWQPLAPKTLQSKARIGRAKMGILRRYNTLWASLTKRSHPLGYRLASDHGLILGTSVLYGEAHQLGTLRVPQRKIVPDEVPESDREQWAMLIAKHAAGA